MKLKSSVIIILTVILLVHNIEICTAQPKSGRYILGSIFGSIGCLIVIGQGGHILGFYDDTKDYSALPSVLALTGIGFSIGSSVGTTVVATNKWKVFKINFAVAAISSLLCLSTETVGVGSLLGVIVVPIFSAANAYRIDKQDYYSKTNNSQQEYSVGHTNLMKDPIESMIQREIINEGQNYTPMGQRINVVKMPLLSVSW